MVVKGTFSNDVWSSASVARKAERTLASSRREVWTSGVTSWRKMISGDFGPSRIWPRMSLAREMAREEKASMFHDVRESLCATWLCAFLEDTGAHIRVEGLKAERVRQSLLVAMVVCWKAGGFWLGFKLEWRRCGDSRRWCSTQTIRGAAHILTSPRSCFLVQGSPWWMCIGENCYPSIPPACRR